MIISAMISEVRREYRDVPKNIRVTRNGDGVSNLFNLANFPVIEESESVNISGGATLVGGGTDYTLDNDSGDLTMNTTPAAGDELKSQHKFAHWRDKNWNEAINQGIQLMNARGFFVQISRTSALIGLSAGVRVYNGPSACIDIYEALEATNNNLSAAISPLSVNWSYQQDSNRIILGQSPTTNNILYISYLRNLQIYAATSATVDLKDTWVEPVKKYAGSMYFRSLASKIATQGNATIDEGHFSYSNLRTTANDLLQEFDNFTTRAKPTRPAKDMQFNIRGGGRA